MTTRRVAPALGGPEGISIEIVDGPGQVIVLIDPAVKRLGMTPAQARVIARSLLNFAAKVEFDQKYGSRAPAPRPTPELQR